MWSAETIVRVICLKSEDPLDEGADMGLTLHEFRTFTCCDLWPVTLSAYRNHPQTMVSYYPTKYEEDLLDSSICIVLYKNFWIRLLWPWLSIVGIFSWMVGLVLYTLFLWSFNFCLWPLTSKNRYLQTMVNFPFMYNVWKSSVARFSCYCVYNIL